MPSGSEQHSAWYDGEGNIVLPGAQNRTEKESISEMVEEETPLDITPPAGRMSRAARNTPQWQMTDESDTEAEEGGMYDASEDIWHEEKEVATQRIVTSLPERQAAVFVPILNGVRTKLKDVAKEWAEEGRQELWTTAAQGSLVARSMSGGSRSGYRNLRAFLAQPVWVPARRNTVKEYSRGTLFAVDVVRFGGTFAMLFLVAFAALNYRSFWDILSAKVDPFAGNAAARQLIESDLQANLVKNLSNAPALAVAGAQEGNLLSFLPPVGPPENRLVIPKLNINVPIVIPPSTSLLAQDWPQLETDIQTALQDGVVHYPGTARPGQAGNFFVTGHSSFFPWDPGKYKSIFARLHDLNVGDEYWIFYNGDRHRYVIQEEKEVSPSDVSVLDQPTNQRIGTLMTCTPIGTSLRRLILVAREVDPLTGQPLAVGEHEKREEMPKVRMESLPI